LKSLQNSFTTGSENVHHLLEDKRLPEILVPAGALRYLVLPSRSAKCLMNSNKMDAK
jgi:hypothetical protein